VSEQELAGHAINLSTVEHDGNEVVCAAEPDREKSKASSKGRIHVRKEEWYHW
jgi:hypothetical protein